MSTGVPSGQSPPRRPPSSWSAASPPPPRRRAAPSGSPARSATSRSARPTPTASCCRPTSGSSRSAPGCWSTTAACCPARSARTASSSPPCTWNDFTGFLTIVNLKTGKIIQQVGTGVGADKTIGDGTVAADGPLWSADGKTLWLPQTADLLRFSVAADGTVKLAAAITLETTTVNLDHGRHHRCPTCPSGMALSPDGSKLYVALNGVNELGVIDTKTNALIQTDPGRQRAAPGGAGRRPRLRLQRGRPPGHAGMTSPTTPTARTSWPARSPAPPSPARCPRWT